MALARRAHALGAGTVLGSAALLCAMLSLPGCTALTGAATADVAGIAGAGISRAITKDAAVTTGIGLGVAAGAQAGLQYVQRNVHRAEQDRIAAAAGPLADGAVGHWSVTHRIPLEDDEHGDLVVVRTFGTDAFTCKEIVFSVDTTEHRELRRAFYTAAVCRDGAEWRWASAEPATERWGALQ